MLLWSGIKYGNLFINRAPVLILARSSMQCWMVWTLIRVTVVGWLSWTLTLASAYTGIFLVRSFQGHWLNSLISHWSLLFWTDQSTALLWILCAMVLFLSCLLGSTHWQVAWSAFWVHSRMAHWTRYFACGRTWNDCWCTKMCCCCNGVFISLDFGVCSWRDCCCGTYLHCAHWTFFILFFWPTKLCVKLTYAPLSA